MHLIQEVEELKQRRVKILNIYLAVLFMINDGGEISPWKMNFCSNLTVVI